MYLQNKYSKCYYSITDRAKSRTLTGFSENHHIIPKSLGGTGIAENIVKLTAREHLICHMLLVRMLVGKQRRNMNFALWCMVNADHSLSRGRSKVTPRQYQRIRMDHAKAVSEIHRGKILSDETKKKQSDKAHIRWEDPKERKRASLSAIKRYEDPKQIKLISDIAKNRWSSGKHSNNYKRKPCISPLGEEFESTAAAGKFYNITPEAIQASIKRGFSGWKYKVIHKQVI